MSLILLTICLVLAAPLSLILYRAYCGINIYNRAVKAFGKDKVVFLNRPYQRHSSFFKESMADGIDSLALYTREIRKNPDIKLIVTALFESVYTIVCDPEMIRKITNEYSKNNVKRKFIVYSDAIERGLVFSEGETWKKSRSILSNLFHFEMLRSREAIMHKVVEENIKDLAGKQPDLLKLGCTIGGNIVIESLLGKDFMDIRFGNNTPLEEIQLLIKELLQQTIKPIHIFRGVLFGKITTQSLFLTPSQKRVKERLLNVKKVGHVYLQCQKAKRDKGQKVAPFVEAYLNLNDESYYDEVIQQLIIFLIAGQDTTGQLIETCLYELAQNPEYQEKIINSLSTDDNIHANKLLNNFIQQTNRLIGPTRFSLMRLVTEPYTIDGFEFKKGQSMRLGFGMCMTNVKYFEDPREFKPDRFNLPLEHPHAFTPFSGGARNCIGQHMSMMEVRITLVDVLKKYKLERTKTHFQVKLTSFMNRPVSPYLVRFIAKSVEVNS